MIIILKNADFSSNNIGHVDINDLDIDVKSILRKLTRFPATNVNVYAKAFNDLYVGLRDNGILPKLHVLCIPRMSEYLSQCGVNIANDDGDADLSDIYTLSNGILRRIGELSSVSYKSGFYPVDLSTDDFCCFGRFFGNQAIQGCCCLCPAPPTGLGSSTVAVRRVDASGGYQIMYNGTYKYIGRENSDIFVLNTDTSTNFYYSKNPNTPDKVGDIASIPTDVQGFYVLGGDNINVAGNQTTTIFGCGEGLSATEAKTLLNLLIAFEGVFEEL